MPKLRAPSPVTLKSVRPNAGLEAEYRRLLDVMVEEMHKSVSFWVLAEYRANPPAMAQDASSAADLRKALAKVSNRWMRKITAGASKLAELFADKSKKYTDVAMKKVLKDAGFTVEFKMSPRVQDTFSAVVGEQVGLIKSIGAQHLTQVETIVMQGVQNGRDLGYISTQLQKRLGVTKRRAALIARDQTSKATSSIARARQMDLGIKQGRWRHSGGGKEPRHEHVEASGKIYDLAKGMRLEGVWTWPGVEINCRCTSEPIIPGFDDEDD